MSKIAHALRLGAVYLLFAVNSIARRA